MTKLYSYVVRFDLGFAPNPFGGLCTLAKCKIGNKQRNIVEMVEVGDWIVGTGGADPRTSSGNGTLIYAMRVDKKIPLRAYCRANSRRIDAEREDDEDGRFALISKHFFYFGRNAIDISEIPKKHLNHPLEKSGPGNRSDFSEDFIGDFAKWIKATFKVGVHGPPCKPCDESTLPKCPRQIRRK